MKDPGNEEAKLGGFHLQSMLYLFHLLESSLVMLRAENLRWIVLTQCKRNETLEVKNSP